MTLALLIPHMTALSQPAISLKCIINVIVSLRGEKERHFLCSEIYLSEGLFGYSFKDTIKKTHYLVCDIGHNFSKKCEDNIPR